VATIDRLWAPEPRFHWFSTGPPGARLGSRAYDRMTLAAYFRARVRVHERIRLTELGAGYDSRRNLVHFRGKLVRRADDLRPRPSHVFKGAADCESGRPWLIVWSMRASSRQALIERKTASSHDEIRTFGLPSGPLSFSTGRRRRGVSLSRGAASQVTAATANSPFVAR